MHSTDNWTSDNRRCTVESKVKILLSGSKDSNVTTPSRYILLDVSFVYIVRSERSVMKSFVTETTLLSH